MYDVRRSGHSAYPRLPSPVASVIIGCADGIAQIQAGQAPRTDRPLIEGYERVTGSNGMELPYLRTCAPTEVNGAVNVRNEKQP